MRISFPAALTELGFSSKARTGRFPKKSALIPIAILFFFLCAGTSSIRAAEGIPTIYGYEVFVPPGLSHPWGVISGPRDIIELEGSLDANDTLAADNTYVEFWQITFLYDSRVDISLNSNQIDPFLGLIRVDSTQRFIDLFEDDDSGPGENARITADVQAGTYWIGISTFGAFETGAWSLVMESSTNSRDSSLPMVPTLYGVSVQENPNPYIPGELESSDFVFDGRYVDLYQFEASEDVALQIDLTSDWFDTRLMLADVLPDGSLGTLFLLDEDGGESTNSRISRTFGPGTYFLVATSGAAGAVGEYEISVSLATSPVQASDLVVGPVSVSDDTLEAGQSFTLRATVRNSGGGRAGSTTLRYYRSADSAISPANDRQVGVDSVGALGALASREESIALTAPSAAGTYYYGVCVDSVSSEVVTNNNCSAGVRVTVSADTGDSGDDHGNERTAATVVEAGSDTEGVLAAGDVDYFRVDMDGPGTLEVYTSGGLDTFGRLEDAAGSLISSNDDSGAGLNFNVKADVSQGTYYVRVSAFSSSAAGSYTLHVRISGPPESFPLLDGIGDPSGATYANGRYYVLDGSDHKVYAYSTSGRREASADFDLHEDNGSPRGIAWSGERFHVVDWWDEKAYAYSAAGRRDAVADFDLHEDNGWPAGIVWTGERFHVVDWSDEKVYAYTATGRHDAEADFDLHEDNSSPDGIAYRDDRFYVVNNSAFFNEVFAYSGSGRHDSAASFELVSENSSPTGIALADGRFLIVDRFDEMAYAYSMSGRRDALADIRFPVDNGNPGGIASSADGLLHVLDWADEKVYAYSSTGQHDARGGFDLHEDNFSPRGIAWSGERFHIADFWDNKVYAYQRDGGRDVSADFDLHEENGNPEYIVHADGRFFVFDGVDNKVYAYTATGQHDAAADFDLHGDNRWPAGIAYRSGRFYVVNDGSFSADDLKVYAYTAAGQRDPEADFDLHEENGSPNGIVWTGGRFHIGDSVEDRVYAYDVP